MTCPAMPRASAPTADRRANVCAGAGAPGVSHAASAYVAYASTPTGSVIAVLIARPGTIPGSGWTIPNPHSVPSPTQPDHTATAAGEAIRSSGHRGSLFALLMALASQSAGPDGETGKAPAQAQARRRSAARRAGRPRPTGRSGSRPSAAQPPRAFGTDLRRRSSPGLLLLQFAREPVIRVGSVEAVLVLAAKLHGRLAALGAVGTGGFTAQLGGVG